MIVDTHCHAWRQWPYDLNVPDPFTRGSVDSLLFEMDANSVDHAAIVCARIGGGPGGEGLPNSDNNDYVVDASQRYPDRLTAWVDVDSSWDAEHHQPGAAVRLARIIERTGARGFTHYFGTENDGWLRTEDASEFFNVASERNLIASLAISAAWFRDLSAIADRFPDVHVLIHHMSNPRQSTKRKTDIGALIGLAEYPNIGVKISGFNYNSATRWGFPYEDVSPLFREILRVFGPDRLTWGSDFPASRDHLTYRQSIEVVRTHCAFAGRAAIDAILGGTAARLLKLSPTPQ